MGGLGVNELAEWVDRPGRTLAITRIAPDKYTVTVTDQRLKRQYEATAKDVASAGPVIVRQIRADASLLLEGLEPVKKRGRK